MHVREYNMLVCLPAATGLHESCKLPSFVSAEMKSFGQTQSTRPVLSLTVLLMKQANGWGRGRSVGEGGGRGEIGGVEHYS